MQKVLANLIRNDIRGISLPNTDRTLKLIPHGDDTTIFITEDEVLMFLKRFSLFIVKALALELIFTNRKDSGLVNGRIDCISRGIFMGLYFGNLFWERRQHQKELGTDNK